MLPLNLPIYSHTVGPLTHTSCVRPPHDAYQAWNRWKDQFIEAIRTEHGAARAIQSVFRMHLSRTYVFHYHRWQRAVHRLQVRPYLGPI